MTTQPLALPQSDKPEDEHQVGVLSNKLILEAIEKGLIVIDPFDPKRVKTSSVDVGLGEYYFAEQHPGEIRSRVFNPFIKEHVDEIWGTVPKRAVPAHTVLSDADRGPIPRDALVIMLGPHETILGHTDEFIGATDLNTTLMKARSSWGRCFIEVCKCAGWGDVGYTNRWTMEITNNSQYYTIPLVVREPIAQIVFLPTGPILGKDYTQDARTKYQTTNNFEEVKAKWNPESMKPKLYKDFEGR